MNCLSDSDVEMGVITPTVDIEVENRQNDDQSMCSVEMPELVFEEWRQTLNSPRRGVDNLIGDQDVGYNTAHNDADDDEWPVDEESEEENMQHGDRSIGEVEEIDWDVAEAQPHPQHFRHGVDDILEDWAVANAFDLPNTVRRAAADIYEDWGFEEPFVRRDLAENVVEQRNVALVEPSPVDLPQIDK